MARPALSVTMKRRGKNYHGKRNLGRQLPVRGGQIQRRGAISELCPLPLHPMLQGDRHGTCHEPLCGAGALPMDIGAGVDRQVRPADGPQLCHDLLPALRLASAAPYPQRKRGGGSRGLPRPGAPPETAGANSSGTRACPGPARRAISRSIPSRGDNFASPPAARLTSPALARSSGRLARFAVRLLSSFRARLGRRLAPAPPPEARRRLPAQMPYGHT